MLWPREQIEVSEFDTYFHEKRIRHKIYDILATPHSTLFVFYCTEKTRRDSTLDMSVDFQDSDLVEDDMDFESEDQVFGTDFIGSADGWYF